MFRERNRRRVVVVEQIAEFLKELMLGWVQHAYGCAGCLRCWWKRWDDELVLIGKWIIVCPIPSFLIFCVQPSSKF